MINYRRSVFRLFQPTNRVEDIQMAWRCQQCRSRISWETEAEGMRKTQEISGRFGFIRMLEKSRLHRLTAALI